MADGSLYNGSPVVERSVQLGEPIIYVNFNYRVNAFGWLAGKEGLAGGSTNIGLYDRGCHLPLRLLAILATALIYCFDH